MPRFGEGDRVRVDVPDATDPDHDEFHGEHGTIVAILRDDAAASTGDERDSFLFRVELDDGRTSDFRWRDLRLPIE